MFKILIYHSAVHTYYTYLAYLKFNVYLLGIALHFVEFAMTRDGFALWSVRLASAWVDDRLACSWLISITMWGPIYQPSQNTTNTAQCRGVIRLGRWFGLRFHDSISNHFLGKLAKLRKATISFVMSVCLSVRPSAWNNSVPTGRIFMKFDFWVFFENLSRKFIKIWQK
jgi:hypothetical protein